MAAAHVTTRSILSAFLPRLSASTVTSTSKITTLYSRQLSLPILPSLGVALPSAIQLNIPGLLEKIWDSVLRAVPKKKTSHMKGRSRRLAGKGMKDVTALNTCSACGHVKRAHLLCPYCVKEIKDMFSSTIVHNQFPGKLVLAPLKRPTGPLFDKKKTAKPAKSKKDGTSRLAMKGTRNNQARSGDEAGHVTKPTEDSTPKGI